MAVLVKNLNGLAYANVKNRNGLVVASIKNINGLDATSGGALTLTYLTNASDNTDLTTYTYSSLNIGAVGDRDYVVVVLYGRCVGSNGATVSTVTIGGVSAAQSVLRTANDTTNSIVVAIYTAAVPSGTTANVVVTYSTGMARAGCSLYTIKSNASITPVDTSSDANAGASTLNLNTDSPSGDSVILAGVYFALGADLPLSWTGLTERDEMYFDGSANTSSASGSFSSAATNTITPSTGGTGAATVGVSACFQ